MCISTAFSMHMLPYSIYSNTVGQIAAVHVSYIRQLTLIKSIARMVYAQRSILTIYVEVT